MKSITQCPFCSGILRNNFLDVNPTKVSRIEKICDKRVDHKFKTYEYDKSDNIFALEIEIDKEGKVHAFFQLAMKQIMIYKGNKLIARDCLKLPYFEPDLTNYNKIVSKLKTYILLS